MTFFSSHYGIDVINIILIFHGYIIRTTEMLFVAALLVFLSYTVVKLEFFQERAIDGKEFSERK